MNDKVRIYEISKELNLDNKEILEVCKQLNIAFKSHSSTITQADADRIKSAVGKRGTASPKKSPSPPKIHKKQQILAVHHKTSSASAAAPSPSPANPPKAPALVSPGASPNLVPTKPSPLPERADAIEYVSPTSTRVDRPNELKRFEKPVQLMRSPSRPGETPISELPEPVTTKAVIADRPSFKPPLEEPAPALRARPELNRPQQPPRSLRDTAATPDSDEDDAIEVLTSDVITGDNVESASGLKPKLKRPSAPLHPSSAKRGKWEEEEEEDSDVVAKAGKASGKGKRRSSPILDDEDEELDTTQSSLVDANMVSMSIARPPKPKSMTQTFAAVAGNRPKKPQPKSEATARSKADRRDRRETVQRPEIVTLERDLTIRELADLLKVPETEIVKNLFFKGIAINITQTLDLNTAKVVAEELGVMVETAEAKSAAAKSTDMLEAEDLEKLHRRPPVVTIMGHVDHGKTTLLDSIRKTKVAQGEAGGITQHIGAYHVDIEHNGKPQQIVFLDTPGHEAFTAMRARGARVTDIAILVVAADDGVQPQTQEAISHARAAEVPIVVAINKIDKPESNPDRIKQELAELNLVPEEWGGDVIMVPVSALKGENLDTLLEMILLVSEIEELSANPDRHAKGTVIEAHLDRSRGPVASLLVQNGTLRVGDVILAGSVFGKIRAMIDDRGEKVEAATPSFAVEILGLNDVPAAGDEFEVFSNEKDARQLSESRTDTQRQTRLQQAMSSRRVSLSTLSAQAEEGELKELNLILKADVQGSLEAILGALQQLPQKEVQLRVLFSAPGEVTETDVDLAAASGAVIIGFNTTLASGARAAADREGVDIREYDIIYKLLDDIQGAMEGLLDPEEIESPLGQAEVRAVFPVGRGSVAGCYVQSGKMVRNRHLRVLRGSSVVYVGNIDSLKRMKEDVREVNAGFECGIRVDKFNDWQEGDIIEAFEMTMKRRTLSK